MSTEIADDMMNELDKYIATLAVSDLTPVKNPPEPTALDALSVDQADRLLTLRQQFAERLQNEERDLVEHYDRQVLACQSDHRRALELAYQKLTRARDAQLTRLAEQHQRAMLELRIMRERM